MLLKVIEKILKFDLNVNTFLANDSSTFLDSVSTGN